MLYKKATARVERKAINMSHKAQKGFGGIFLRIPHHQKGYLMHIPSTRKIISSYDVVFDEFISSALAYMSRSYSKAMAMRPSVTYTSCATYPREKTGDIITFTQFEEGNLLSENHNDTERGDKSDEDSIMPPLLSKEEMDAIYYGDESDHDPMSTEMLEDIRDGSQSHPKVNMRETRYKIRDRF